MTAILLTRAVHSRTFGVVTLLAALLAATLYYAGGYCTPIDGDSGIALPSADMWLPAGWADFCASAASTAAVVAVMVMMNKLYNVMLSMTWLYMAFFPLMMLATPDLQCQFYTGTLLVLLVPLCQLLLFRCYRDPDATRAVFVVFALLSLASATQYCFVFYMVVFALGLAQMRIASWRTFTAMLLGIVTPWWIMLGLGIISPYDIQQPHLESIFSQIDYRETTMLLTAAGTSAAIMVLAYVLNIFKTIAYNAYSRAISGNIAVLALATLAAMCIDYTNILSYVPLLNYCAAMEATHYLATHRADRSYIAVLAIMAAYIALFICQTVI